MFENFTDSLFDNKIMLKSQQRFKSDCHEVCTVEVNKIALSRNADKRLQIYDKITTYPSGTNIFKVCESEMMIVRNYFVENYVDCPFYNEIVLKRRKDKKLSKLND